jgi:hypothetical protein
LGSSPAAALPPIPIPMYCTLYICICMYFVPTHTPFNNKITHFQSIHLKFDCPVSSDWGLYYIPHFPYV